MPLKRRTATQSLKLLSSENLIGILDRLGQRLG